MNLPKNRSYSQGDALHHSCLASERRNLHTSTPGLETGAYCALFGPSFSSTVLSLHTSFLSHSFAVTYLFQDPDQEWFTKIKQSQKE